MPVSGTWLTEWTLFQECMNSFAADIARATEERKSKQFKHVWNVICGGCWRRIKNAHSAATARLLCTKWIADERKNEERKNHGTNVADAGRNASFVFEEYRIQITRNSFQTADISYFFFCSSVLSSLANRIMIFFFFARYSSWDQWCARLVDALLLPFFNLTIILIGFFSHSHLSKHGAYIFMSVIIRHEVTILVMALWL